MVMERLRQLDGVAYIRFASVYRAFTDIEEMKQEAEAYNRLRPIRDSTSQLPLFSNKELDTVAGGVTKRAASNYRREEDERKKQVRTPSAQ
jgi:transcriptional repressor NrdR